MKVLGVRPNERDPHQAFVTLETGVVAWSPDFKAVEPLIGKELPEGWTQKPNKAGTGQVLLPPRPKGSAPQAAYRNTKEGQEYEQERMDRRTALMQAVQAFSDNGPVMPHTHADGRSVALTLADEFYEWLRSPVSRAQATGAPAASLPPRRGTSSAASPALGSRATADTLSADTGSAAPSGGAGALGEAVSAPSGTTRVFPKKPGECPHRAQLVSYEGEQVCGGCGLPDALIGVS